RILSYYALFPIYHLLLASPLFPYTTLFRSEHEFRSRVSSPRTELDLEVAMLNNDPTNARKLRSRLSHPIIDADGHWLEYAPLMRSEEHTSELQSRVDLVCRLLLE